MGAGRRDMKATALNLEPDAGITRTPQIFIGSSKEGIHIARALQEELRAADIGNPVLWSEDPPYSFTSVVDWLEAIRHKYDAAVFIYSPDDTVLSRATLYSAPRDNVIYELGFFQGALSRWNCFVVADETNSLKLQSDLAGMTLLFYSHDEIVRVGARAALREAAEKIRNGLATKRSLGTNTEVGGSWFQVTWRPSSASARSLHAVDLVNCIPLYGAEFNG
ncbi:MAG: TIR domain-containing protein, partial [Actinomycetota bacterium]